MIGVLYCVGLVNGEGETLLSMYECYKLICLMNAIYAVDKRIRNMYVCKQYIVIIFFEKKKRLPFTRNGDF